MSILAYDFMQRALVAALATGLATPAVGTYLVQRRLSLMGDGIGHVAVAGVALALITGTSPTWIAVAVCVVAAVLIELIREHGHANGDVALALLFYGGLASGVLLTGLGGESAATLQQYLFGSITAVSDADVAVTVGMAAVILVVGVGLAPQLFAVSQDLEFASVAGLRVRFYTMLTAVIAAVSVTVAMRTVGLLLVSALMVVPVASAQQLTRTFRATLFVAMALGTFAAGGGLMLSAFAPEGVNVQPGPTIVLLALAVFALTWPLGAAIRRKQRLHAPFPELSAAVPHEPADDHDHGDHQHVHGDDCGHPAVPHGDHVDYIHDGHRHAPHGEHYDEH